MRFFSLHQTSRAVLFSIGMSTGLVFSISAQAATIKPASVGVGQAGVNKTSQDSNRRLTPANSTDGIIALVNDSVILKSDLVDAIAQTQARAQAAGQPQLVVVARTRIEAHH